MLVEYENMCKVKAYNKYSIVENNIIIEEFSRCKEWEKEFERWSIEDNEKAEKWDSYIKAIIIVCNAEM